MTIRIESDGTPEGTRIIDKESGREIQGVSRIVIECTPYWVEAALYIKCPEISINNAPADKLINDNISFLQNQTYYYEWVPNQGDKMEECQGGQWVKKEEK